MEKWYGKICYKVSVGVKLQKEKSRKNQTKLWNFNDPLGWEKFRMLTGSESSVWFMWESLGNTEESYQLWKKQLNDIIHQCFRKKKIQKDKNCLIGRQGSL